MVKKLYAIGCLLLLSFSLGCAKNYGAIRYPVNIYPERMEKDVPLVLAVPGLNVPGIGISQEQHFGDLVEMLAQKGIPSRILAYDTPEHPLTSVASLADDQTNIALTRVGPAVIEEIQREKARRAQDHLPPLKEVVFFSYSQGGVIAQHIAQGIYLFKRDYEDFCGKFGMEWCALQKDPEFTYLMNALVDYLVIESIKVQRENDFVRDPDLRNFYRRAKRKLHVQANEFGNYLKNPRKRYPDMLQDFDPPETGKYPKIYPKFSRWVDQCLKSPRKYHELEKFFIHYAYYRRTLDIHFRFMSTAGSYFGSPNADAAYALFESLPFLKPLAGAELRQIRDTRLGSTHQTAEAQSLLALKRLDRYPLGEKDTLFIVGANGDQGDGMVDQSSAHLTNHALGQITVRKEDSKEKRFSIVVDRLPDLVVVPLALKHLPEDGFPGGHCYGAAYMEKDNPVFPYLLAFVHKDWPAIEKLASQSGLKLQQFMVQISFDSSRALKDFDIIRKEVSQNIRIDHQYTNPDSHTIVWTGHFVGNDQRMNSFGSEDDSAFLTLEFSSASQHKDVADVPVYPGCNTLVRMKAE